jgi:hypothetical protein
VTRALAIVAFLGAVLAVDTQVDAPSQLLLGLASWLALALALRGVDPLLRAQALVVVPVATCAEIVGSIIWGVYTYRLENLPSFVPPCHGLVYLAGAAFAAHAVRHRELLVRIALVGVLGWGILGVTVLPRTDVAGALGAILLAVYLVRGRAPHVYAGVFLVVAWLELYGTAIGTWAWAVTVPGTGVPQGNPPSGVAAGYVWFDIVALAVAPRLLAYASSAAARSRRSSTRYAPTVPARLATTTSPNANPASIAILPPTLSGTGSACSASTVAAAHSTASPNDEKAGVPRSRSNRYANSATAIATTTAVAPR